MYHNNQPGPVQHGKRAARTQRILKAPAPRASRCPSMRGVLLATDARWKKPPPALSRLALAPPATNYGSTSAWVSRLGPPTLVPYWGLGAAQLPKPRRLGASALRSISHSALVPRGSPPALPLTNVGTLPPLSSVRSGLARHRAGGDDTQRVAWRERARPLVTFACPLRRHHHGRV